MAIRGDSSPSKTAVSSSRPRMRAFDAARQNPQAVPHDFDALLGPFYDTESVAELLGISVALVRSRATLRELLMLRTADEFTVFPAFQFMSDGKLTPGLNTLLGAFEYVPINEWTQAIWLVAENPELESMTPIAWLSAGGSVDAVLLCMRRDSSRWRR